MCVKCGGSQVDQKVGGQPLIEATKATHRRFIKCRMLGKDDTGVIHLHARPWRTNHVFEVVYYAPGGGVWEVPDVQWDSFLATNSHISAMSVLRELSVGTRELSSKSVISIS